MTKNERDRQAGWCVLANLLTYFAIVILSAVLIHLLFHSRLITAVSLIIFIVTHAYLEERVLSKYVNKVTGFFLDLFYKK